MGRPSVTWTPEQRAEVSARMKGNTIRRGKNLVAPIFIRDGVPGRVCISCLSWKPLVKFARHSSCAGGRRNVCTRCSGRASYAKNSKRSIEFTRKWQADHPNEYREIRRAACRRRNHRRMVGPGVSVEDYRSILSIYGGCCAYCGKSATTMDHVTPLSRGGIHGPDNLVPACQSCNFSKHTKTLDEWNGPKEQ